MPARSRSIEKAIALNAARKGSFAPPHVNLSAYYNRTGDPEKALEYARKAIELDPKSDRAWFQKGRADERRGSLDDAVAALNQAIALNPRASSYYYVLAGVYRRLGWTDDSRKALEMFKRLEQESSELEKKRRSGAGIAGVSSGGSHSHPRRQFLRMLGASAFLTSTRWPPPAGGGATGRARRVHGRHRRGRPAARPERLREPGQQAVPARGDGLRRRVLRLRQRRLARHLPGERQQPRSEGARRQTDQLSVSQQPRRHVHRRHAEGRPDPFRLGPGLLRRRLRQRRLRRSVRHLLGPQRALPQQRRRHVHRRLREGRRRRVAEHAGARAAVFWTTTATAISICSSPAT